MKTYDASQIQVLEGLAGVRKRPSMYIGDTNVKGLHQLAYEVLDNSIDEALAGFCSSINIIIHEDGSITIEDNGRGIPVDLHPLYKVPALELVMTKLHAGGKFDHKIYKVAGGLHGVGLSVVNALSSELEVEIRRDNKIYYQKYKKGNPVTKLKELNKKEVTHSGTKIRFKPDPSIFEVLEFSFDLLANKAREVAYLVKGLKITVTDERTDRQESFCYTEGIVAFIKYLNRNKGVLHNPLYFCKSKEDTEVEYALQYTDTFIENVYSYANTIHTQDGGMHLVGFKSGLTKAVNEFAKKNKLIKEGKSLSGDDIREGLTAIISVKLKEPQFEGQTKTKLGNSWVKSVVESIVLESLRDSFQLYPDIAKKIVDRCLMTMRARDAAKKAKELTKKKAFELDTLPGKLAECSEKDPKLRELYIVEGDSAGGSAKQGRDRRYQAILPLRGKILNVEKTRADKVLSNDELRAIIAAIGTGVGKDNINLKKVKYSKIIIMTDADVDGSHIRTLLLTFFYRYMQPLVESGMIYIACPPLYCIKKQNKEYYAYSEKQLHEILAKLGEDKVFIQRYKGLGEMNPEQLWKTTMNPKDRTILKVTIEDVIQADYIFSLLMGDKIEPRREFIIENAKQAKNLDI
jgi:DNA gyrase subunit B